ncbi:hypothetical protein EJ02DRAFT_457039 [Clathrospora elynae]|uniref:Uncharacterized protein n=1 Tax=Clathrospora elynae TaxID=706981 RepID=A0A6A5SLD9_9PLEO|nr:hypothetical protein EJ02DRAFT_457039 [Clathrospora elynae]
MADQNREMQDTQILDSNQFPIPPLSQAHNRPFAVIKPPTTTSSNFRCKDLNLKGNRHDYMH